VCVSLNVCVALNLHVSVCVSVCFCFSLSVFVSQGRSVTIDPKALSLGEICCGGSVERSVSVFNRHNSSILVSVSVVGDSEITVSPASQVIPAGSIAGFDVGMCSESLGELSSTLTLDINDHHQSIIHVTGEVVAIHQIVGIPKQMSLSVSAGDSSLCITETLTIENQDAAPCRIQIVSDTKDVILDPSTLLIHPGRSGRITLSWMPTTSAISANLTFQVTNGYKYLTPLTLSCPSPDCQLTSNMHLQVLHSNEVR